MSRATTAYQDPPASLQELQIEQVVIVDQRVRSSFGRFGVLKRKILSDQHFVKEH